MVLGYQIGLESCLKVSAFHLSTCSFIYPTIANQMTKFCFIHKTPGLRIAPPEAPVTGYMFGKGVYFADMFSKSANYCCASQQSSAGVLLLCEVVHVFIFCFHMNLIFHLFIN